MATSLRRLLLLLLLSAVAAAPGAVGGAVHDMLPEYGLPQGLLPDSVKSYSLSPSGEFEVELKAPCYVQFSDLVYYEKNIKGKLTYGKISDLSGIQAKKVFIWVSVSGIEAHPAAGTVEFKVGFLSETLPVSEFERIPVCKAKASCRGAAGLVAEGLRISEEFQQASENPVF
ncbi:uncharacterized protein LOC103712072 [Phoenix dactylifera]|uniref:Uncharacterized protein LOC103712072 n=1 Tax=Phoenix dactylifera TaxID=42345 RepID=A0A8B7CD57_PHODC|nr:uncharacterized protein LOC103712072 [Phoenix dactylifera]